MKMPDVILKPNDLLLDVTALGEHGGFLQHAVRI
jgi:hypothetical protein